MIMYLLWYLVSRLGLAYFLGRTPWGDILSDGDEDTRRGFMGFMGIPFLFEVAVLFLLVVCACFLGLMAVGFTLDQVRQLGESHRKG